MESIGDDARAFLSAAREVALTKPIIVIKAGRTEAAARAAASHTGALTGSDEVLDAAFRRTGVLRVSQISDVFDMAEVLGKQPRPRGPRLTVGPRRGPGVLATGLDIRTGRDDQLSGETQARWTRCCDGWSHVNQRRVATPNRRCTGALEARRDPPRGLLVCSRADMTDPT